jgi:hypothetical protein
MTELASLSEKQAWSNSNANVIRGFHGVVAALYLFNATDSPKQFILLGLS